MKSTIVLAVIVVLVLAFSAVMIADAYAQSKALLFHDNAAAAAQHGACWKAHATTGELVLSYCTNSLTSTGTCTCN